MSTYPINFDLPPVTIRLAPDDLALFREWMEYNILHGDELSAELAKLAERILQQLPK